MWKDAVHVSGCFGPQCLVYRSWNMLYPGCDGSALMLSACSLTLDVYKTEMEDMSTPVIFFFFSAVLTIQRSLFLSCLEAKPNQTVMDVLRKTGLLRRIGSTAPEAGNTF